MKFGVFLLNSRRPNDEDDKKIKTNTQNNNSELKSALYYYNLVVVFVLIGATGLQYTRNRNRKVKHVNFLQKLY